MKRIVLLICSACTVLGIYAQQASSYVSGRIVGTDSLAIPGVAVVMQTLDSAYVNAGVSDLDGRFSIESSVRPYRLLMQHLAYQSLAIESSQNSVGTMILQEAVNELGGVTIKAERPILKMEDGKLSYDLKAISENKLINNAFELTKELPSISSNGSSLSIIGGMGNMDILIDGKKSNRSTEQILEYLKSLPASQVERIEVAYNPPAAWHVKGSAINIVLKREKHHMLQGQVQATYTNQYANSYQTGGNLFFSSPKIAFDLIYNYNDNRRKHKNLQEALQTIDQTYYRIQSDLRTQTHRQYHNLYSSLKYDFENKSRLELSYVGEYAPQNGRTNRNHNCYTTRNSDKERNSLSLEEQSDYLHDVSINYTSAFGLQVGIEYTGFRNQGWQTLRHLKPGQEIDALAYRMEQRINRANLFADMEHKLPHGWKLSYGVKYDYTKNNNEQHFEDREHNGAGNYDLGSKTQEHITEAHVGINKSFLDGKLNLNLSATGEFYKINEYKKNSLLPTASIHYALTKKHAFQLAYRSLRLYPSYWQRQDYTTYEDEYNMAVGNPTLRPSRYSYVNFLYILRSKYIFQIAYHRIQDLFLTQDYQSPEELHKIRKTVNANSYCFAINAMIPFKVGDYWSARFTISCLNDKYKNDQWFDLSYNRNKWVGLIAMNNSVTLIKRPMVSLQLSGYYKSPYIQGIWNMSKVWGANAGIKWEIVEDKALLSFHCIDIFNSQYPKIKVRYANQHNDMDYTAYQRRFIVSFTYSFKGYKEKQTKRVDTSRYGI